MGSDEVVSVPGKLEVGLRSFHVRVAPVCSGYEGIGLILIFLVACLVAMRKSLRSPLAFLLLPIGVLAAWSANVLRITALIVVGSRWSPELAFGGFHSKAGWILFCCVALGLAALAHHTPFSTGGTAKEEGETWNPSAAYLMPFLTMGAPALVTGLVSPGTQALYPVRVAAALIPLWIWRRCYGPIRLSFSWAAMLLGAIAFVACEVLQEPEAANRGESSVCRSRRSAPPGCPGWSVASSEASWSSPSSRSSPSAVFCSAASSAPISPRSRSVLSM